LYTLTLSGADGIKGK